MKTLLALVLIIHGFIHLIAFLEHWKVINNDNLKIDLTFNHLSLGINEISLRLIGFFFLVTSLLFLFIAYDLLAGMFIFWMLIWRILIVSLVLCIISWPRTRLGIVFNIILMMFLILNQFQNWIQ